MHGLDHHGTFASEFENIGMICFTPKERKICINKERVKKLSVDRIALRKFYLSFYGNIIYSWKVISILIPTHSNKTDAPCFHINLSCFMNYFYPD